jgi:hypothetical protein
MNTTTEKVKLTEEMFAEACRQFISTKHHDVPGFERCWLVAREYISRGVGSDMDKWFAGFFEHLIARLLWEYEKRPRLTYYTWSGINGSIKVTLDKIEFNEPRRIHGRIHIVNMGFILFKLEEADIANAFAVIAPMFEEIVWCINKGEYDIYSTAHGPGTVFTNAMEGRDD